MDQTTERRRYMRQEVVSAVMITRNGKQHAAQILDISTGGARLDLPVDWTPPNGSALRIFFLLGTGDAIVLEAHVARMGIDHMGVAFDPAQEDLIRQLMGEINKLH